MKRIVIDASVALKWVLNDEEHIAEASQILLDMQAGGLEVFAPDLLCYEFSNVLWLAARQGRLTSQNARAAARFFQQLRIQYQPPDAFWYPALDIAFQYQRTFYDSAYIALAQQLGVWCFTGDRRLYNALHTQLNFVRWVGDYRWDEVPEPV
jgi:predicted nucleic acid-binding protein